MSRKKIQARLELREREGRTPMWVIVDSGKTRISTGCEVGDYDGAKRKLAEYLVETTKPADDQSQTKLGHMMAYYLRNHAPETAGPQTLKFQCAHLKDFWAERPMADMIGPNFRAYVEARVAQGYKGRPLKPVTAWKELRCLGTAVKFYCTENGIASWPRVVAGKNAGSQSKARERVLERHEFARMLLEARRRGYKHIVRFLLIGRYTGTRLDCLLRLRWMPALDSGHIDLRRGILKRLGSAEVETKKKKPPCELPPKLLSFCRRWQAADAKLGITHVIHSGGQPISDLRGHWLGTTPRNPWSKVVEAAGLASDNDGKRTSDVTPHVLRHTCVSWGLWEGRTPFEMAGVAGMTVEMVYKVYGHHQLAAAEYRREKARRLAKSAARRAAG